MIAPVVNQLTNHIYNLLFQALFMNLFKTDCKRRSKNILITLDISFQMESDATRVWEKRTELASCTISQSRMFTSTIFYVFGITQPGIKTMTSHTQRHLYHWAVKVEYLKPPLWKEINKIMQSHLRQVTEDMHAGTLWKKVHSCKTSKHRLTYCSKS